MLACLFARVFVRAGARVLARRERPPSPVATVRLLAAGGRLLARGRAFARFAGTRVLARSS